MLLVDCFVQHTRCFSSFFCTTMAEASAAVPSQFNYQPIPPAVGGYASQAKQPPSNGTVFAAGQTIEIPLTTGRVGQFIDPARSYLLFRVSMTTGSAANVGLLLERVGAAAFIETMEIWLNGQPIEQIYGYNNVAQLAYDLYYGLGRADLLSYVEGCAYRSPMGVSLQAAGPIRELNAGNNVGTQACAVVSEGHFTSAGAYGSSNTVPANNTSAAIEVGALGVRSLIPVGAQDILASYDLPNNMAAAPTATSSEYANFQVVPNTIILPSNGAGTSNSGGRYFAIPLISGLLGTLANKMFPALTFAPGSLMLRLKLCQPAAPGTRVIMVRPTYTGIRTETGGAGGTGVDASILAPQNLTQGGFYFKAYTATDAWQLEDVNFVAVTLTLQAHVSASILSAAQAASLDLHTKSFTTVYSIVPQDAQAATIIVPIRKLSLNSLFFTYRDTARQTGTSYGGSFLSRFAPTGACINSFSWYTMFGNERIREYPYTQQVETLVENLRALDEWTDLEINFGPALRPIPLSSGPMTGLWDAAATATSYVNPVGGFFGAIATSTAVVVAGAAGAGTSIYAFMGLGALYTVDKWSLPLQSAGFFHALDLDVFNGTSGTSRSGRNTTGDQITLYLTNGTAVGMFPGATRTMQMDAIALHDLRINIQAGGIAVPVS